MPMPLKRSHCDSGGKKKDRPTAAVSSTMALKRSHCNSVTVLIKIGMASVHAAPRVCSPSPQPLDRTKLNPLRPRLTTLIHRRYSTPIFFISTLILYEPRRVSTPRVDPRPPASDDPGRNHRFTRELPPTPTGRPCTPGVQSEGVTCGREIERLTTTSEYFGVFLQVCRYNDDRMPYAR